MTICYDNKLFSHNIRPEEGGIQCRSVCGPVVNVHCVNNTLRLPPPIRHSETVMFPEQENGIRHSHCHGRTSNCRRHVLPPNMTASRRTVGWTVFALLLVGSQFLPLSDALKCICNPRECDVIRAEDCPGKSLVIWDPCMYVTLNYCKRGLKSLNLHVLNKTPILLQVLQSLCKNERGGVRWRRRIFRHL